MDMKRRLRRMLRDKSTVMEQMDADRLLLGELLASSPRSHDSLDALSDAEFKVFSQFGEDGIIDWLVSHLPGIPESFVEFGVEDYQESNTRFLLERRNWRGVVLDSSSDNVRAIRDRSSFWRHDLTAVEALVTVGNVNELIAETGLRGDIGILSVDIDGNDYWVLDSVTTVSPWIVIVEYNAVLGDLEAISVPYSPDFVRSPDVGENLYFGVSIAALCRWADRVGYELLGTNRAGCNAFFVRSDKAGDVSRHLGQTTVYPSRFRDARGPDGELTYRRGVNRIEPLLGLPFVDVADGQTRTLGHDDRIYSDEWLRLLG